MVEMSLCNKVLRIELQSLIGSGHPEIVVPFLDIG